MPEAVEGDPRELARKARSILFGKLDPDSRMRIACVEALDAFEAALSRAEAEREEAVKALEPFKSGWMTSDTEHTNRTVIAHMHPERSYELHLTSDDFLRAQDVSKRLSSTAQDKPE